MTTDDAGFNEDCRKCGVVTGEKHEWLCDFSRCQYSGEQLIQCTWGETLSGTITYHGDECVSDVWDGEYPGVKECRKYGLYTSPDSLWGLGPDLNSLAVYSTWNVKTQEYVIDQDTLKKLNSGEEYAPYPTL